MTDDRFYEMLDEIDRLKKAGQELVDAVRHLQQNFSHPDQFSDEALDAWNAAVKGDSHD